MSPSAWKSPAMVMIRQRQVASGHEAEITGAFQADAFAAHAKPRARGAGSPASVFEGKPTRNGMPAR